MEISIGLEMKIFDAMHRIKDLYTKTNGECVLSFSGGKDSTIVADLYLKAMEQSLVGDIKFLFADTQVEYDAIYDFVKWFNENRHPIEYLKPRKPFAQILKEYGLPVMSKVKSNFIGTYFNTLAKGKDPLKVKRSAELIIGLQLGKDFKPTINGPFKKDGVTPNPRAGKTKWSKQRLANKHFQFLHPNLEYKTGSKCCDYLKKYPFEDYYKEHQTKGYFSGIRIGEQDENGKLIGGEGGIREEAYRDSCESTKKFGKLIVKHKMPLWDWTEEDVEEYIKVYNIKISKAYTKYGLKRTGCIGCPFAIDIHQNLKALYVFEPNKYKAVIHWLGLVYMDLEVELDFDTNYMKNYKARHVLVKQRRLEMLKEYSQFRKTGYKRYMKKENQTNIFEYLDEVR